jgi:hypothetical protein
MDEIIAFDTETTTDRTQRFLFGSFRYGVRYRDRLSVLEEGIIYADDLPDRNPEAYETLVQYVDNHRADVDLKFVGPREPNWRLTLLSRSQFAEKWLWKVAYQREATVVGFNLPFDLSRIAIDVTDARPPYADGFSFQMWKFGMRPNLRIKHVSSKKAFIGWTLGNVPDGKKYRGKFVDLRTAAFALTNAGHSLSSAGDAFGTNRRKYTATEHGIVSSEYVDYNRNDVSATWALYSAIADEYARHPISLPLEKVYSPASIAKAYYHAMGVVPPLEKFTVPDQVMGHVMSAFFGGRSECMIRHVSVPVTLVDFTSMYPTVNALMRLWFLLTARKVKVTNATEDVRTLLRNIDLDSCFNSDTWRNLAGVARIKPQEDVLPIRAKYGADGTYNIGINYLTSEQELWYAIPDLVASKLLTGKAPEVVEAITFEPIGTEPQLREIKLRGELLIEPKGHDFFSWIIEERARVRDSNPALGDFLKVMANAGSYGIFAEMNRDDSASESDVNVFSSGDASWHTRVRHPERPGRFAFPPVAACITAAARLMLAMLERCVTDAGGCWAMMDTDSMAIVTHNGEHKRWNWPDIPALEHSVVDDILKRFDQLSPYDRDVIPHLVKQEFVGDFFGISAKRYALSQAGTVVKYSEHGLGHLRGPSNYPAWMRHMWARIIQPGGAPFAFGRDPALAQWTVSTPSLYHTLRYWNEGKDYADRIKPFNFVSVVYVRKEHKPRLPASTRGFQLMAPYLTTAAEALMATWVNKYDPMAHYMIGTELELMNDRVKVVTYADVLMDYRVHPEAKFAAWDGSKSGPLTTGRLRRIHVTLAGVDYLGKESNRLEESTQGQLALDETQLRVTTSDQRWDQIRHTVFRVLGRYKDRENARLVGISDREYRYLKTAVHRPNNIAREKLIQMAVHIACEDLRRSPNLIKDPRTLLMEWQLHSMAATP